MVVSIYLPATQSQSQKAHHHLCVDTVTTEVQRNRNVKHVLSHLEKMAKGDSSVNIRAQVGEFCKDAGEQVQCLIDLATDPSILGRMWVGWQPFV